jgi:hypothetical protein
MTFVLDCPEFWGCIRFEAPAIPPRREAETIEVVRIRVGNFTFDAPYESIIISIAES